MPTIEPYRDTMLPDRFHRWLEVLRIRLAPVPEFVQGAGTPEGVVFASKGTRYFNTTGGAGTLLYVKNSAAALNTGWVAYG
jgi:hypothetical protein